MGCEGLLGRPRWVSAHHTIALAVVLDAPTLPAALGSTPQVSAGIRVGRAVSLDDRRFGCRYGGAVANHFGRAVESRDAVHGAGSFMSQARGQWTMPGNGPTAEQNAQQAPTVSRPEGFSLDRSDEPEVLGHWRPIESPGMLTRRLVAALAREAAGLWLRKRAANMTRPLDSSPPPHPHSRRR